MSKLTRHELGKDSFIYEWEDAILTGEWGRYVKDEYNCVFELTSLPRDEDNVWIFGEKTEEECVSTARYFYKLKDCGELEIPLFMV